MPVINWHSLKIYLVEVTLR